jgi:hypothetical protein
MKIAFRIENGVSQLILTPENARDKQCLDLCMDGKQDMRLKPTAQDHTIIEFCESKPKSIEPTMEKGESNEPIDDPGEPGLLGRANQEE